MTDPRPTSSAASAGAVVRRDDDLTPSADPVRLLAPSLADVAAHRDAVMRQVRTGQMSPFEANDIIAGLAARDDFGVEWTLNPTDGRWYQRDLNGRLHPGTPPTDGQRLPTPHEMSHGTRDPQLAARTRAQAAPAQFDLAHLADQARPELPAAGDGVMTSLSTRDWTLVAGFVTALVAIFAVSL